MHLWLLISVLIVASLASAEQSLQYDHTNRFDMFYLAGKGMLDIPFPKALPAFTSPQQKSKDLEDPNNNDHGDHTYKGNQGQAFVKRDDDNDKSLSSTSTLPHGISSGTSDVMSSSTRSDPWRSATRTQGIETASSTPIKNNDPIRYTIDPGQVHRYEISGFPMENDGETNVYITLNVCGEPYIKEPMDLDDDKILSLYGADSNTTGDTMRGMQANMGFANVTLRNVENNNAAIAEIRAPDLGNDYHDKWTYEIGISSNGPLHGVSAVPNLYLVDTDFAHALFVTGNFSQRVNAPGESNISDYEFYVYPDYAGTAKGLEYQAMFNKRLLASFCAISTGPALLNTNNTNVSTTTRGYGHQNKGQYYAKGLNKSTNYLAYLTQPNINGSGGLVYEPVGFTTKSETNCQIVYDMEFCSEVAFAAPGNASSYSAKTLSEFYDGMAKDRYKNFSLSLQNVQCNASDEVKYTMLKGCDDCADSYKQWLCAVTIPRCTDWSNDDSFLKERPVGTSRNPAVNELIQPGKYKEILPCADLCYRLVQDCSPTLNFLCPKKGRGLEESYGEYSDDGYVSCSYPGAVYFLSAASRVSISSVSWLVLFIVTIYLT